MPTKAEVRDCAAIFGLLRRVPSLLNSTVVFPCLLNFCVFCVLLLVMGSCGQLSSNLVFICATQTQTYNECIVSRQW